MSNFEQYLIEQFGETWERSGIMNAHNAALDEAYEKGRQDERDFEISIVEGPTP